MEEKYKDLTDWKQFQAHIDALLAAMDRLRHVFEEEESLEEFRKDLGEALQAILDGMQREFPPIQDVPGHKERKDMIHTALGRAEVAIVELSAKYGMDEGDVRERFESVSFYLEELAVTTGMWSCCCDPNRRADCVLQVTSPSSILSYLGRLHLWSWQWYSLRDGLFDRCCLSLASGLLDLPQVLALAYIYASKMQADVVLTQGHLQHGCNVAFLER